MISRGDVWYYPYLWKWQQNKGETEGRKPRETACVVSTKNAAGVHELILIAITSQPPESGEMGVEIPELECRRAGLDANISLWATVSEYNHDIAERSYYLDPKGKVGSFSEAFINTLTKALIRNMRDNRAAKISRNP